MNGPMGHHGCFQIPPPEEPAEEDTAQGVEQHSAEDDERRQGDHGRQRGQVADAEQDRCEDIGSQTSAGRGRPCPRCSRRQPVQTSRVIIPQRSISSSTMPP